MELGLSLVSASPVRPRQYLLGGLLHRQDERPEQMANLCDTQPNQRPRRVLKVAMLLPCSRPRPPFFGRSAALAAARITVSVACAHIANVIWRYQPVQLRTSY